MNFYNSTHPYYCGIDLHARILYVCIIDNNGQTIVHKEISADANKLHNLLEPYIGNIVVGVECMHCWYWVSDFCDDIGVDFILGHALYMTNSSRMNLNRAADPKGKIHGDKAKNDKIDFYKITKLILSGNFPLAYTYPKEMSLTRAHEHSINTNGCSS